VKKILSFVLKLLVSLGLLLYLFYFSGTVNIHKVITTLKQTHLSIFIIVFFICLTGILISAKRWSLFLPETIRYSRLLSLFFIGSFFNTFMPGHVGGDIAKMFYLYRDTGKSGTSIASVFMDRYMGLCAMVIVSIIAFIGGYSYIKGTEIVWIIPIASGVFLIISLTLWKLNWGKIKFLNPFYNPFIGYKTKKGIISNSLLLSLIVQVIGITEVYLLSLAIGLKVPVIYFFIFVPIINVISAIPISIAGLGVRETGFVALFKLVPAGQGMVFSELGVTSDHAISLSILLFVVICLVSLIGGIEYLRIEKLLGKTV